VSNDDVKKDFRVSDNLWRNFRRELIYQNRFFPKADEMLNKIRGIVPMLADSVQEGSKWYRAREIEECNSDFFPEDYDSVSGEEDWEMDYNQQISSLVHIARFVHNLARHSDDNTDDTNTHKLLSKMVGKRAESSEWGYSKDESGMPPRDKAGLNRASPRYIPYLYLTKDINTALAETEALVNQPFSVAKYKITKSLNIVNFCKTPKIFDANGSTPEEWLFCINIHNAFSKPSPSNEKDYLVSQYIAEYVKTLGFEGIAFRSSRNKDGVNLTLFDDSACEFLESGIYEVTDIEVKSRRIFPLPQ
jgi:hypothetical protein